MVEIQEEALATVEEAEAEDVIPLEAEHREDHDAREEGKEVGVGPAVVDEELCAERAVAIHMLDVGRERGISVVEDIVVESGGGAAEVDSFVDGSGFELGQGGKVTAEEAERWVGV